MLSLIFVVLHCIAVCSGGFYEPPAPVCPTKVDFSVVDVESLYPQYTFVRDGPYPDIDVYIENAIVTSTVTATKVVLATETRALKRQTMTKVELERSALTMTQTSVSTVTKVLENTDINIVTVTATNYQTEHQTRTHTHTTYVVNQRVSTTFAYAPSTVTKTVVSTFTITESPVITTEVTLEVPYTQAVYVTVHRKFGNEITRTSTETRTVCQTRYLY